MPKNSQYRRRVIVTMALMAALVLVGVTMMKVGSVDAQRVSPVNNSATQSDPRPSAEAAQPIENPGVVGAMVKMICALVLVIALVYGALHMLRRLMGRRLKGSGGAGSLEVLETTYVGQHKAISLVRVGQRSVLVGVTDNQITTLTELDAEETEEILGTSTQPAKTERFSGALSGAVERLKTIGLRKKQAVLET
ncbi:MAG: flagellar biosynthetic protein FliO [candidate division Zixibacteria bacterium]|nr:flagellar biosynthetic protein FliO [candidate division Zixibacteria bacterium]